MNESKEMTAADKAAVVIGILFLVAGSVSAVVAGFLAHPIVGCGALGIVCVMWGTAIMGAVEESTKREGEDDE